MNRKEELINLITDCVSKLDQIDDMIETQSVELQTVDFELSDLYHLIESNDLTKEQSYKIVKKIHELRLKRRDLNNEHEIENTYNNHKSKLSGDNTRQFLLSEIRKTNNRLDTEYKNRVLTDENVNELLNEVKKKGRPKKYE